jgi:hypothetical protein
MTASPPAASGFAAFLLGRMLTADLGEPAQMIEARGGLICRIRAPVTAQARALQGTP